MITKKTVKTLYKLIIFLFQLSKSQIYIATISLYVMFTPACFDISVSSSGSFKNVCLSKLHKLLKSRLLKLQLDKFITLKYIKILFGRHGVIQ